MGLEKDVSSHRKDILNVGAAEIKAQRSLQYHIVHRKGEKGIMKESLKSSSGFGLR